MRGKHSGDSQARRLFDAGLAVAGLLLGAGSAVAQEPGQGALACYQMAERQVSLNSDQALALCRGATSAAPAECFIAARAPATFLDTESAIQLCRCSTSTAPVACFQRANQETFLTDWEILQLCSPSLANNLLVDCQPYSYVLPRYPWWWH